MKLINVLRIASLLLLPVAIAPAYAQGREQGKPAEQKPQQARPAQAQQHAQPQTRAAQPHAQQQAKPAQPQRAQQQAKRAQPQQRAQQQAKPAPAQRAQQQAKPAQAQQHAQQKARPAQAQQHAQQKARPAQAQQQSRAKSAQSADRAQTEPGHGRIPDDRFRASFGRGHTFHVSRADFTGGSRRFQYGGYWFSMVNAWPVGWLYTDAVYVDYMNGGYFLCDPIHPGVYVSITVG